MHPERRASVQKREVIEVIDEILRAGPASSAQDAAQSAPHLAADSLGSGNVEAHRGLA